MEVELAASIKCSDIIFKTPIFEVRSALCLEYTFLPNALTFTCFH